MVNVFNISKLEIIDWDGNGIFNADRDSIGIRNPGVNLPDSERCSYELLKELGIGTLEGLNLFKVSAYVKALEKAQYDDLKIVHIMTDKAASKRMVEAMTVFHAAAVDAALDTEPGGAYFDKVVRLISEFWAENMSLKVLQEEFGRREDVDQAFFDSAISMLAAERQEKHMARSFEFIFSPQSASPVYAPPMRLCIPCWRW